MARSRTEPKNFGAQRTDKTGNDVRRMADNATEQ
jgi:hypothetical protein